MYDVPAVAAAVAPEERVERGQRSLAVQGAPRADPARELLHHRGGDERGEGVRQHSRCRGRTGGDRGERAGGRAREGRGELALERRARCAVPGELRAHAHQEKERKPEGDLHAVEVRAADRELGARDRFRDERVERPEQHGQHRGHEDDVLEEEDRFPRERRADRARVAQAVRAPEQEPDGKDEDRHEVAEQERSDRGLRERVHAIDHAASGEEGAKYGQRERRDDESEIPGAQEAAFLLDHHRMQVRGRREPRHDRGVLDRVPRPVATPAEHRVAPPRPGDDPDPEERPGHEREASRRDEPTIASLPEDEGAQRIGEWD